MNKSILAVAFATALLSACNKPADNVIPETATTTATAAAPVATDQAAAPSMAAPHAAAVPAAPAVSSDADVDKAIDSALSDHAAYRKVMEDFQKAVAAKDATAAAALVHYPIGVDIAGKNTVLKNPAAFVKDYDKFMTPEIAKAITDTRYADVMVNYKGVMLGQGEAWINGICKDNACKHVDVKVVTIQAKSDLSP